MAFTQYPIVLTLYYYLTGKPFSKCGKCKRYMKYIAARPSRLFCTICEDVYTLPQGGSIKQYKNLECPLDGFELVLFSLGGKDGKTYPLCPLCFAYPPFEGIKKVQPKYGIQNFMVNANFGQADPTYLGRLMYSWKS